MHSTVKYAIAAVAAGTIALTTVGSTAAEARRGHHHGYYHRHHNGAGYVFMGALSTMAAIAAANEYGYYGYPSGSGYPYWNGSYWVYGPAYGGPVYPGAYWR